MARNQVSSDALLGPYAGLATTLSGNVISGSDTLSFVSSSYDLLYVDNPTGGSVNVTVTSTFDRFRRIKDIVFAVPAGQQAILGPFDVAGGGSGWVQPGNLIYVDPGAPGVKCSLLQVPT
jgi:hypothetical protein